MEETFALAAGIDAAALAARFAEQGRISIAPFLAKDDAQRLYTMLRGRDDWRQVVNSGEKIAELDRATRAGFTPEKSAQYDRAVYAAARNGFQHRYESLRVPDDDAERAASADPLCAFARWLSSPPVLDLLRTITGAPAIAFADAQATAYSPGDFLTAHNDSVPGKNRHAAYVLGLTPQWRTEWGGLLMFHDSAEQVSALVPGFNRLNLFSVPQMHSVSEVSRAAASRRYAITGWLRG